MKLKTQKKILPIKLLLLHCTEMAFAGVDKGSVPIY